MTWKWDFLEVDSVVVTWWIVAVLCSVSSFLFSNVISSVTMYCNHFHSLSVFMVHVILSLIYCWGPRGLQICMFIPMCTHNIPCKEIRIVHLQSPDLLPSCLIWCSARCEKRTVLCDTEYPCWNHLFVNSNQFNFVGEIACHNVHQLHFIKIRIDLWVFMSIQNIIGYYYCCYYYYYYYYYYYVSIRGWVV